MLNLKLITIIIFIVCALTEVAAASQTRLLETGKLLEAAVTAIEGIDLTTAKTILNQVVKSLPNNDVAQTLLGVVAEKENKLAKAVVHFAQAVKFALKFAETYNNYGAILLKLNRRKEAAREFAISLAINPNQSSAVLNLNSLT